MIKKSKQQGFSLLEILIAFSILAFSLGILLNIFSGGLRRTIVSEEYQQAVIIAQSKLAAAGVETELEEAKGHGKVQDKYAWSVQVQPYDDEQIGVAAEGSSLEAFQVTVKVEWAEGKSERIVELNTLRLVKKE